MNEGERERVSERERVKKKVNKIYELGFNTYQLHASFTITSMATSEFI